MLSQRIYKRRIKDSQLQVRIDRTLKLRLKRAGNATDTPPAQIVREAIKEKLDRLAEQYPDLRAA